MAEGVIFRNDVKRTDEQMAAFASVDFDITDQFTATLGARYYDVQVDLLGSAQGSFGNLGASQRQRTPGKRILQLKFSVAKTTKPRLMGLSAGLAWRGRRLMIKCITQHGHRAFVPVC